MSSKGVMRHENENRQQEQTTADCQLRCDPSPTAKAAGVFSARTAQRTSKNPKENFTNLYIAVTVYYYVYLYFFLTLRMTSAGMQFVKSSYSFSLASRSLTNERNNRSKLYHELAMYSRIAKIQQYYVIKETQKKRAQRWCISDTMKPPQ